MSLNKFCHRLSFGPPDPVNEEALSDNRKMITNQQLELYNEAAADVLNGSKRNGRSRVKLLAASRQAAMETIGLSDDGLHLPESTRNVVGGTSVSITCFAFVRVSLVLNSPCRVSVNITKYVCPAAREP